MMFSMYLQQDMLPSSYNESSSFQESFNLRSGKCSSHIVDSNIKSLAISFFFDLVPALAYL